MERQALQAEISRLERKLASSQTVPAKKVASDKVAARTLLAEIDDMEEQIASMDEEEDVVEETASEEDMDFDELEDEDPIISSESAPGVEDTISQDRFTEVEKTRSSAPATSGPSVRSVAPTGYTARLQEASTRLDRVAAYLEKHGKTKLAYRLDRISDAIDAKINKGGVR